MNSSVLTAVSGFVCMLGVLICFPHESEAALCTPGDTCSECPESNPDCNDPLPDDPEEPGQCTFKPYIEVFDVEMPLGGGDAHLSFDFRNTGPSIESSQCSIGVRCLCEVEVRVQGRSDALYRGSVQSDSFTVPFEALPRASDGEQVFIAVARTTELDDCSSSAQIFEEDSEARGVVVLTVGESRRGADAAPLTPPDWPEAILASAINSTSVEVSWQVVSGAEEYQILRRGMNGAFHEVGRVESGERVYIDTVLPGEYYEYQVIARNEVGASLPSPVYPVEVPGETDAGGGLRRPAAVSVATISSGFEVIWRDESDAEHGYLIERRDGSFGEYQQIAQLPANSTQYIDTAVALIDGRSYHYRVTAFRQQGNLGLASRIYAQSEYTPHCIGWYFAPRYTELPVQCSSQDVNSDGFVTLNDALLIVSDLRNNGSRAVGEGHDYDVNGDDLITLTDALVIISSTREGSCDRTLVTVPVSTHDLPAREPAPLLEAAEMPPRMLQSHARLDADERGVYFEGFAFRLYPLNTHSEDGYTATGRYQLQVRVLNPLSYRPTHVRFWAAELGQNPVNESGTTVHFAPNLAGGEAGVYLPSSALGPSKKLSLYVEVSQFWQHQHAGGKWVSDFQPILVDQHLLALEGAPECGNNVIEPGEQCDHGSKNGDPLASFCLPNCRSKNMACYTQPERPECQGLERFYEEQEEVQNASLKGLVAEGEAPRAIIPWSVTSEDPGMSEFLQASVYKTLQFADINGDGKEDYCIRKSSGLWCQTALASATPEDAQLWSAEFADNGVFEASASQWATLTLVDVNGDGRADACARFSDGIRCGTSEGGVFSSLRLWGYYYSDRYGWDRSEYAATIRFVDIDADSRLDVCGVNQHGLVCARSRGDLFEGPRLWQRYYSRYNAVAIQALLPESIVYPRLDSDSLAEFCGLAADGEIYCARSQGYQFSALVRWTQGLGADLSTPLHFVDLNGDGREDVCAAKTEGLYCAVSNGNSFEPLTRWSTAFVSVPENQEKLLFADSNADGLIDVCQRSSSGLWCALSEGDSFSEPGLALERFTDTAGWSSHRAFLESISLLEINGDAQADVCAMAGTRLYCALNAGSQSQPVFHPITEGK